MLRKFSARLRCPATSFSLAYLLMHDFEAKISGRTIFAECNHVICEANHVSNFCQNLMSLAIV